MLVFIPAILFIWFDLVAGLRCLRPQLPLRTLIRANVGGLVALTREDGKNGKLAARLAPWSVTSFEAPCIAHGVGPDRPALLAALSLPVNSWEFVIVTSPEAAKVKNSGTKIYSKGTLLTFPLRGSCRGMG